MSITLSKVTLIRRLVFFFLLPLAVLHAQDYSLPYVFTTFAGTSSYGATDGTGQAARFFNPSGIAIDKAGIMYIADASNHAIRKMTPSGAVTTFAGSPGKSGSVDGQGVVARFKSPQGIAVDSQGNVYVADTGNHTIRKITPAGQVTTLAGKAGQRSSIDGVGEAASFVAPLALVVDSKGNLFVIEGNRTTYVPSEINVIRKVAPTGEVTTFAGRTGTSYSQDSTLENAGFLLLQGIAIDGADSLYVTDGGMVRKVRPEGVTLVAGLPNVSGPPVDGDKSVASFGTLHGVTVDSIGNIYVVDGSYGMIRKITNGMVTTIAGKIQNPGSDDGVGSSASFNSPTGIAIDASANVFVTDAGNNTVRKIIVTGGVSTVAGISYFDGMGEADGLGAAARFYQPGSVAVGPAGEIYVADVGNNHVRKITPQGLVTTFSAYFPQPTGVTVDSIGNVYVFDPPFIRKITPVGDVSTLATLRGIAEGPASAGPGDLINQANVYGPLGGMCIDTGGNIYVVAGANGKSLFKITLTGAVTVIPSFREAILAQTPSGYVNYSVITGIAVAPDGTIYACDSDTRHIIRGTPSTGFSIMPTPPGSEQFDPYYIAADKSGRIFVTEYVAGYKNFYETSGSRIGRLLDTGLIELVAGPTLTVGGGEKSVVDGSGRDARFMQTAGIAIDGAGNFYLVDGIANVIRKGQLAGAPVITTQPQSQSAAAGTAVQLSVVASSMVPMTYQWSFNGNALGGATSSSYTITSAQSANAGDYIVVITNAVGSATSSKATLTVTSAPNPPSTGGGGVGGGGGGAPSTWFFAALLALGAAHSVKVSRLQRRKD